MSLVNGKHQAAWVGTGAEPEAEGSFAGIVFNRPIDRVFTYRVPPRLRPALQPGQRVRVPLGRGNEPAVGYCVSLAARAPDDVDSRRLKDVLEVLDDPPLIDAAMLDLTRWLAGYYACSWGQALDAVVPAGVKKGAGTRVGTFLLVPDEVRRVRETLTLPAKQAEALAILCRAEEPLTVNDLCRLAKCATGPIAALRQRGHIHTVRRRIPQAPPVTSDVDREEEATPARPELTAEQLAVMARLTPALEADAFGTFLIHGVTGSGKTEVYLRAIERVVERGGEAIVLVPEISLTPQTIRRFRRRFARVAILHSHLSDAERHRHWKSIAAGEIQVVVGARSAIFAPARRLGLIVIDEEHEGTFKQETTPRYHARDVAVKRAQLQKVPVLLGSATPSLETWRNAELGRYVRLPMTHRVGDRPMPAVDLIDLRHEKPPLGGLSEPLRQAMISALDDGGQVILLLNRRGFHTFVICPNPRCGQILKCDACDVALTFHKGRQLLICHTCDAERVRPPACPSCRAAQLHYGGIGTERLEREVRTAFPDHVTRRMDSDTMRTPGSHEQVLSAFRAGEVRILLGTQMIAKGLDFPDVTLVGVVNADTGLHMPDFRAAERTFQLVTQVAGRTGRGARIGRVLVQTYSPDHPAILCALRHDYEGFVSGELPERQRLGVPPFGRMVRLIARGADEPAVRRFFEELACRLRESAPATVQLLGPAPAPILKIRNLYRYHLRLLCPTSRPLQGLLRDIPPQVPIPHGVELAIDIDPMSML
jgi:primosomal protein N' (replication factor Y) (superfamily II helicase)